MFVPLSHQIPNVYDARMVKMQVRVKADKTASLELPSAGYQSVVPATDKDNQVPALCPAAGPSAAALPCLLARSISHPRTRRGLPPPPPCHDLGPGDRLGSLCGAAQLVVTLDLQRPLEATAADLAEVEYSKPSAMVDSTDEVVVELSHQIDPQLRKQGHRVPAKGQSLSKRAQLDAVRATCRRRRPFPSPTFPAIAAASLAGTECRP